MSDRISELMAAEGLSFPDAVERLTASQATADSYRAAYARGYEDGQKAVAEAIDRALEEIPPRA